MQRWLGARVPARPTGFSAGRRVSASPRLPWWHSGNHWNNRCATPAFILLTSAQTSPQLSKLWFSWYFYISPPFLPNVNPLIYRKFTIMSYNMCSLLCRVRLNLDMKPSVWESHDMRLETTRTVPLPSSCCFCLKIRGRQGPTVTREVRAGSKMNLKSQLWTKHRQYSNNWINQNHSKKFLLKQIYVFGKVEALFLKMLPLWVKPGYYSLIFLLAETGSQEHFGGSFHVMWEPF